MNHSVDASKESDIPLEIVDSTCYLFGVPSNLTSNDIEEEFAKRDIYKPKQFEKFNKSKYPITLSF